MNTKNLNKGPPGMKLCARCDHWLPKDRFGADAQKADRLASRCRPCRSAKPPAPRKWAGGDHVSRLRVAEVDELDRRENALKGWNPDASCLETRARVADHMARLRRRERLKRAVRDDNTAPYGGHGDVERILRGRLAERRALRGEPAPDWLRPGRWVDPA